MGLSVPRNMGPSVPSFHGIASSFKVSNGLCLLNMFSICDKGSIRALYRTRVYLCPAFMELCVNLKGRLVCVYLTSFKFVIKGPPVLFAELGTIRAHEFGFICSRHPVLDLLFTFIAVYQFLILIY